MNHPEDPCNNVKQSKVTKSNHPKNSHVSGVSKIDIVFCVTPLTWSTKPHLEAVEDFVIFIVKS